MTNTYKVSAEFTTPFGKVAYRPYLTEKVAYSKKSKKIEPNDNGSYQMSISWSADSKEGKEMKKMFTELNDKAHEVFPDEEKKNVPFKEKNGLIILNIDNKYEAPKVLDMNKAALPPAVIDKISSGSTVRVNMYYKEAEGFGKSGIKLYLKKIQVKDLVEFDDSGFDDDDDDGGAEGGFTLADLDGLEESAENLDNSADGTDGNASEDFC